MNEDHKMKLKIPFVGSFYFKDFDEAKEKYGINLSKDSILRRKLL